MDWKEGREEELHHYKIFVTLKGNISLVHETIVPINLITLTKNKYKYFKCLKQKEGFIYYRYYLTRYQTWTC